MEKLKQIGLKIADYFKDVLKELKKVSWPTREQLVNNTISVLVVTLIVGIVVWVSDTVLMRLLTLFVSR